MDEVLKHGSGATPSGWVGSNMVAWPFTCILVCCRLAFQMCFGVVLAGLSGKSTGNRPEIDWKSKGYRLEIDRKSIGNQPEIDRDPGPYDPCDPGATS